MEKLRLIIDPPASGAWNMAVDEGLLNSASEQGIATLRLYQWQPATLSLGYFQKAADRSLHGASESCDMVRRASGGGAILHHHELTYSYAIPVDNPRSERVTALFDQFHESLIRCLGLLGVESHLYGNPKNGQSSEKPFLCFQRRSSVDVIVDGYKVCGSAQRRSKNAVLQHGSVLLGRSEYAPELPGLNDLGGTKLTLTELTEAWLKEISPVLGVSYDPVELSEQEKESAINIHAEKFNDWAWTNKK
ncbi:MAG: lipoate--protein ligase family protein [Pirellulales bacterium]